MKTNLQRYPEYRSYLLNKATNMLIIVVITMILGLLCIEKFLLN
jgi:fumarate reductase subunit C